MGKPCPRCSSLRTEERPLFTGTYTHCLACDEPRKAPQVVLAKRVDELYKAAYPQQQAVLSPPVDYWLALGWVYLGGPHEPKIGQLVTGAPWCHHDQFDTWDAMVSRVKAVNSGKGVPFIGVGVYNDVVVEVRRWIP